MSLAKEIKSTILLMMFVPLALLYHWTEWKWIERVSDWIFDQILETKHKGWRL